MKAVFMGTPEFAADILRALLASGEHQILAVYTQPDRPAGRGHSLKAPPVKELALEHNIPVFQPLNFKEEGDRAVIAGLVEKSGAEVFLVAAYGLILPQSVLDMPKYGCINVHASLLPKWRGAAPIQRSIMAGEHTTGITIMQMEAGLDTGPIILQRALGIGIDDTSATLHDELAQLGGKLLLDALKRLEDGTAHRIAQDPAKASYAAKLVKQDGRIDFSQKAVEVHAILRGVTTWPGARAVLERIAVEGKKQSEGKSNQGSEDFSRLELLLEEGHLIADLPVPEGTLAGTIMGIHDGLLAVACADKAYGIARLRPAGGKSMKAADFSNGYLSGFAGRMLPVD